MGGDLAPRAIVEGVVAALAPSPEKPREPLEILLVGVPEVMKANLDSLAPQAQDIRIIPAREVITMSDPPTAGLRKKPDSSIRVGIDLLTRGEADAFFSAGNSGAVMATASLILKRPPGVDRPALAGLLPCRGRERERGRDRPGRQRGLPPAPALPVRDHGRGILPDRQRQGKPAGRTPE